MQKPLASLLILSLMTPGCASYVSTNCSAGSYAHCDDNRAITAPASFNLNGYEIRDNLLFLAKDDKLSATPASKEEVLDFALRNPGFVVMYDPISAIATLHRQVYDFQDKAGEVLLGMVLLVVGTAAVVALARNHESCYDKHISKYRQYREQTHKNIFQSDEKGVGSKKWHHDINISNDNAMSELSRAFACF